MKARGFNRRYCFTGTLTLKSGLHIGSGWVKGSPSDSPVIRTPDGKPFIPGSSFKGAFRSLVEKMAIAAGAKSCQLMDGQGCIGPQGETQKKFNRENDLDKLPDEAVLELLDKGLCDTCKLFGSPYTASRIIFSDLYPIDAEYADTMIQIRDGVAIDRDSEKAVDKLKYDYEVVAPAQQFEVEIWLEDPDDLDLALTCLGINEFVGGRGYLGGNRSRGLGNCQIDNLKVYELDLITTDDAEEKGVRLKKYLLGTTLEEKMEREPDPQGFLNKGIMHLPVFEEDAHA